MSLINFRDQKFFGRTSFVPSGNVSFFVLLMFFFIATAIPALAQIAPNGTFTVTETWSVTYIDAAGGRGQPISYSGRETGTISITNGQYTLVDHTGVPGGDPFNTTLHTIAGGPPYTCPGVEYPFAGTPTQIVSNGLVNVIHLSFFSVTIPTSTFNSGPSVSGQSAFYSTVGESSSALIGSGSNDVENVYYFMASSSSTLVQQDYAPAITSGPDSQTVLVGSNATFYVSATGNPAPSYQWSFNGAAIPGATLNNYTITNVQAPNKGDYSVIVSNNVGFAASTNAVLNISSSPTAPVITGQPASQNVLLGSYPTFYVSATGLPAPAYQWQFNGVNIALATGNIYTVPNAQFSDQGNYSVVVSNSVGSVTSSNATLTVHGIAPTISIQPTNMAVIIGSNATFTVTATGVPAPTYQWQFNSNNIASATDSSYTVTNAQLTCAGNYSVIVSNSASAVASSDGYLAVAVAPFFYGEYSLGDAWCWMEDTTNHIFGYFNYSPDTFPFLFHLDLGEEYFFDAGNANSGGYFYMFDDGVFFYTEPGLFPYMYDFHRNAWMWYEPDASLGVGRYTSNPRWFYNTSTKKWVNHL